MSKQKHKNKYPNKLERAEVKKVITRLYIQGFTQTKIAKEVNLSQQQVSKYIAKILETWQKSDLIDIDEYKSKELVKLNVIEFEAWAAWENSKTDDYQNKSIYLKIVLDCIEKRCKILGFNAPELSKTKQQIEIVSPETTIKELSKEQLLKELANLD